MMRDEPERPTAWEPGPVWAGVPGGGRAVYGYVSC